MGLSADGQGAVTGKPELMLLPQKVSTGLTDIMMPVADEAELEKIWQKEKRTVVFVTNNSEASTPSPSTPPTA